jgi:ketosteroid isomerase-like protein
MISRSTFYSLLLYAVAATSAATAQTERTPPAMDTDSLRHARTAESVASIVAAERAFRADVARLGVRDGFIRNFAAEGILFRPGPVNAIEFLRALESQPGLLEWEPSFAAVSLSNDLGFTTGPWTYRPGEADSVVASGFYSTVWERDREGVWRAVIDHGVGLGRPAPVPKPQNVATPTQESIVSMTAEAMAELSAPGAASRMPLPEELKQLDRTLSIAAGRLEDLKHFLSMISTDARLLRQGRVPIAGAETIESLLMSNPGGVTYMPGGVGVSQLMDFAYTWGGYWPGATGSGSVGESETGNYVHIWRNEASGWKLLFEVLSPHPPAATKP